MLTSPPQLSVNLRGNWIANRQVDANKLYAVLCCIVYWLDSMQYGNDFKLQFKTILKKYPSIDTAAMGFPHGWDNETLWK